MGLKQSAGWSFARVLLVAAVVGTVGGVVLANFTQDDRPPEEIAEAAMEQAMAPAFVKATDEYPSMEPDPRSLAGIPPYPNAAPRKLTSSGTLPNTPMVVSWFETPDPPERVMAYYTKAFEAAKLPAMAQMFNPNMGYVGWMEENPDGGAGLLHMVSVTRNFRKTMVLVSASRPELMLEANEKLPGGLRLPDEATPPRSVKMAEGAQAAEVFYSRVENMTGPEVVSFFERQFQERGFKITESASSETQFSVVGAKDGTSIVVGARNEGQHISIVLTYSRLEPQEAVQ